MAKPLVTVLVCTFNDGPYLKKCIDSVLAQTYKNFEFVIVNDASTDNAHEIIKSYKDKRIRYIRRETNTGSLATIRNYGLQFVKTKYIFFTDGDCIATPDWLKSGMEVFAKTKAKCVEGRIVYNYDGYKPRFRDRVVKNENGNLWSTASMGYETALVRKLGFRAPFDGQEDRDIAIRIMKNHKIHFAPKMLVYHQQKLWTVKSYLRDVYRHVPAVRSFKDHGDDEYLWCRIESPGFFFYIFCPFLIVVPILQGKIRTWSDLTLLPFSYIKAWYLRYVIWKTAMQERVFVI